MFRIQIFFDQLPRFFKKAFGKVSNIVFLPSWNVSGSVDLFAESYNMKTQFKFKKFLERKQEYPHQDFRDKGLKYPIANWSCSSLYKLDLLKLSQLSL